MKKIILILFLYSLTFSISEAQWIQQNSGTNQNLYDIEFINEKTGWAVGDAGVVIKTTDGGANWINVPNPSGQYGGLMWSICPVDSEVVYAVAGYDFIMKTIDGGTNWSVLSGRVPSTTAFKSLYFLNRDTGWFLGTNKVFRTYDGGNTLDSFYAPWFTNFDIHFKNIDTGIFCGTGRVFKTTDRGETWFDTKVPTFGTFHTFQHLAVINNIVWVAAGSDPPIFRSIDFCESWEIIDTLNNNPPSVATCISFSSALTGWIGGSYGHLYKTTDGGYNWLREETGSDPRLWRSIFSYDDSLVWGAGGAGRLQYTTTGGQTLVGIFFSEELSPDKFELYQNYPNPFNTQTEIKFDLIKSGHYKIEAFDMLGRSVDILFNEFKYAGSYKINFNASDLSSGVYFYKLSSPEVNIIKKFTLVK